jgi:DNA-binding phage protein
MIEIEILNGKDVKALSEKAGGVYNLSRETGIRVASLYRYINGTAEPSVKTLIKLNEYKER